MFAVLLTALFVNLYRREQSDAMADLKHWRPSRKLRLQHDDRHPLDEDGETVDRFPGIASHRRISLRTPSARSVTPQRRTEKDHGTYAAPSCVAQCPVRSRDINPARTATVRRARRAKLMDFLTKRHAAGLQ